MNKTNYKQYDTRWGGLPYPKKPWYIKNCGCGEVAICNTIIEMSEYTSYTPATIQPYCKQYAAPNGDGTYHSGIPAMMKHYGMTEVMEHATMKPLWDELAKGDRVAIYLMGKREAGSKKIRWTSSGHFVCSVGYKYENGKHCVYVKDSNSTSANRNGWITYEGNMKYAVLKVWSGKIKVISPTEYRPTTPYEGSLPNVTIKEGSKGDDAKACQSFLNWCINAGLSVDGNIGSKSVNAIKIFQKTYGLGTDGAFGSKSRTAAQKIIDEYSYIPKPYSGEYPDTTVKETVSTERGADILAKAKEFAWPAGTSGSVYKYSAKASECGKPRPAYAAALKKYMGKSATISQTDCGYFSSTCVRAAGISSSFLCLPADGTKPYPALPSTMKIVHKGVMDGFKLKPGDIVRWQKTNKHQHTVVIIDSSKIAHASRGSAFPRVSSSKPWTAENTKTSTLQVLRATPVDKVTTRNYLKEGDKGEEVKKLQKYINWFFGSDVLAVDGNWGPNTQKYCVEMQKKLGFSDADGLVGAKTIDAMKAYKK